MTDAATSDATRHEDAHEVSCLEVWGGNRFTQTAATLPGLDLWVYSRPHAGSPAGGDLHLASSCANGRIARVLLADVAGHGSPVEDRAIALRRIMRRFANHLAPDGFLQQVSREFEASSSAHEFATAVVGTYLASTGELTLAHAGHPPSMLFDAQRNAWFRLDPEDREDNLPLGLDPSGRYSRTARRMAPGDMILYYTDAWIEAPTREGGEMGTAGLLELLNGVDVTDAASLLPRLRQAFEERGPGLPEQDDATLLLMRATARRPRWRDRILSTPRMLGALFASLLPGGPPFPMPDWGAKS